MWNSRPVEVAVTFVDGMYPLALMGPDLIAETDAYLEAHKDAAPPIRRYLIGNRDDAARALKARALDAAAGAGHAYAFAGDLTEPNDVRSVAAAIHEELGATVDVLVNNAGGVDRRQPETLEDQLATSR